jgi:hypothetical protein
VLLLKVLISTESPAGFKPRRAHPACMNVPALVESSLGDEDVAAHVSLKGEDALFVTPTRTLLYTADGLLSDEEVQEFSHDAEGVEVSEGRRKAKITLDYGLDGEETFSLPAASLDEALHPILAGVLNAAGVTEPGETVTHTYRFSELTLVVTSNRVVKHVGAAAWSTDYEEIAFETVTGIDTEEGNVSSQLVLETTGRTERIKAPNEQFRAVREAVEEALFAYHGVSNAAELQQASGGESEPTGSEEVSFGEGVDPIDTSGVGEDDDQLVEEGAATRSAAGGQTATGGQAASEDQSASANQAAAGRDTAAAGASGGESPSTGEPTADTSESGDEFESSGFQAAAAKVEPAIDPDEFEAELEELEATIVDLAETIETQREVIDAQQSALEAQERRLNALRDLVPDE